MKKLIPLVLTLFFTLITSCSFQTTAQSSDDEDDSAQAVNATTVIAEDATSTANSMVAINYLGNASRVYSSANSSRFYTGQVISNFRNLKNPVVFTGNLVEYTSIKKELLDYVNSLPDNNALMHQNYDGIEYKASMQYVEFSSYADTKTGIIQYYEIRVFFGNFLDTFETSGWYAKSVMFNSSFTKDVDNNKDVSFGEPLGQIINKHAIKSDEELSTAKEAFNTFDIPQNVEDKPDMSIINRIGTAAKIYAGSNTIQGQRLCTGQTWAWHGAPSGYVKCQGNLVEYTSVLPGVTAKFAETKQNAAMNQCYNDITFDSTKTYIEVFTYVDSVDGTLQDIELRLIDHSYFTQVFSGSWNFSWYAKSISYRSPDDIK